MEVQYYNSYSPALIPVVFVGLFVLFFLIWIVVIYNRLVNLRNVISESWSDVDTELRRRHDLIPNLVETVKGYAAHERQIFETVAEARSKAITSMATPERLSEDESGLVRSVRQLLAVAESYPDLKADQNFLQLQEELVNTEDRIQAARRFYNGNIREYNTVAQSFPSSIIAGAFGFGTRQFFEIEDLVARAVSSVVFQQSS
ncbi:MAG: LemA family protein [Armatimonadota bacterium]|nr:LemA family protein [Armatimonadota bacterium]